MRRPQALATVAERDAEIQRLADGATEMTRVRRAFDELAATHDAQMARFSSLRRPTHALARWRQAAPPRPESPAGATQTRQHTGAPRRRRGGRRSSA